MHIHFIAIGGAAMHNLAIALHLKGYKITGSDDEIFEPSKSRLEKYGLLPSEIGWHPENITTKLDAIILGMHARADNPELIMAKELGLKIFSYPEYLYEQSKSKKRIVVAGSHGKTTITAMILHVLNTYDVECDYMVGAQLEGFEVMVKLSDNAPIMVIEGDEYLTSPIDRRPKFHLYMPDIAVISGIAWDHINVFPTFQNYTEQFKIFIEKISENGTLIYFDGDNTLKNLAESAPKNIKKISYDLPDHHLIDGKTYIKTDNKEYQLHVFGKHNLHNMLAAQHVCAELGIERNMFYEAISSFKGASKRLELVHKSSKGRFYKDFAHAPSKLKATIDALKNQYPSHKLIACLELHTFSSLNIDFLPLYKDTMNLADIPCVYFNPHTLQHKKLPPLTVESVKNFFNNPNLMVFNDAVRMCSFVEEQTLEFKENFNVLFMSSGNFDGVHMESFAKKIL